MAFLLPLVPYIASAVIGGFIGGKAVKGKPTIQEATKEVKADDQIDMEY